MKTKRMWAAAVIAVMVLAAGLTACGNGGAKKEGTDAKTISPMPDVPDGTYRTDVSLKGGDGEVSVQSPATVVVRDGQATAVLVWNSTGHDYMKVGGKKVEPVSSEGGSAFRIQVPVFDEAFVVTLSSNASGKSEETEYSLTVSSSGLGENAADLDEEYAADKEASEKAGQTSAAGEEEGT